MVTPSTKASKSKKQRREESGLIYTLCAFDKKANELTCRRAPHGKHQGKANLDASAWLASHRRDEKGDKATTTREQRKGQRQSPGQPARTTRIHTKVYVTTTD